MGEVYEAVDRQLDRTVAVKVLRPELAADRRFLSRFGREARTSARLSHPGIVAVHDIGEDGGRAFIVMEFVAGRTLGKIVHDVIESSNVSYSVIGAAVADALGHAHDRGVVHRDVSPGNVMLTPRGEVKVLDFGIARASRGSARSSSPSAHGTVAYVAPEQARGEAADQRADIYALGAVLYELLTGRAPITGGSTTELVEQLSAETPAPISALRPEIPAELDAIVVRCLAKEPTARFERADQLAVALRVASRAAAVRRAGNEDGRAARVAGGTTVPIAPHIRTAELPSPGRAAAPQRRRGGRIAAILALTVMALGASSVVVPALRLPGVIEPRLHGPRPVPIPTAFSTQTFCSGWFSTRVDLTWTPGGPSDGYQIWRRQPGDAVYSLVARIHDWRTTSFTDDNLGVDLTYDFVIRALHGPRVGRSTPEVAAPTPLLCLS
jgi:Serine/threonine protein kinase